MKILVAVYAPGAAEAIAEVVKVARRHGDLVTCATLGGAVEDRAVGGATAVFARQQLEHLDLRHLGYHADATHVPTAWAQEWIERERPDAVLVGCSRDPSGEWLTLEDALVAAADHAGIGAVQALDSWDVWFPRKTGGSGAWLAAPDEAARQIVQHRGKVPSAQVVATGQPALDAIDATSIALARPASRDRLGVAPDERVILYCGQVSSDNPLTLEWTVALLGRRDRLIFHRHPRDSRTYDDILASAGDRLLVSAPRGDDVFAVADVCVTHTSTLGLRAVAHGVPVVNLLLGGEMADVRSLCGGYPLAALGVSREVHTGETLADALAGNIPRPDANLLRERLHLDGRAAERIRALLDSAPSHVRT